MEQECLGCRWIAEEIGRREELLSQFCLQGDGSMAAITRDTINGLVRDRQAHIDRDHSATQYSDLQALAAAIEAAQPVLPVRTAGERSVYLSSVPE